MRVRATSYLSSPCRPIRLYPEEAPEDGSCPEPIASAEIEFHAPESGWIKRCVDLHIDAGHRSHDEGLLGFLEYSLPGGPAVSVTQTDWYPGGCPGTSRD